MAHQARQFYTMLRKDLLPGQRQNIVSLLTQMICERDFYDRLKAEGVLSPEEFTWQAYLRTYITADNNLLSSILDLSQNYAYECFDLPHKPIVTAPPSERYQHALVHAYQLMQATLVEGHPGSCRTAIYRDLAAAFGKPVFYLTFSEGISPARILDSWEGVALLGMWACLTIVDLPGPLLSVLFQAIDATRLALHSPECLYRERRIHVSKFSLLIRCDPLHPDSRLLQAFRNHFHMVRPNI